MTDAYNKFDKSDKLHVRNVIRFVSKRDFTDTTTGVVSVDDLNEYLSSLHMVGYRIVGTHYLGETPEGFGMWYVLERDESN